MSAPGYSRGAGFSLIEAIVALVILSVSLSGIFTWINTELISLRRAEAVVASSNILEEAIVQLELLPLADGGGGKFMIGEYQVRYSARLVEPSVYGRAKRGTVGLYDHQLYDLELIIMRDGLELGRWYTRSARYFQAREPSFV